MGRVRNEKMGPRTIDIDILLLDDQIIREPNLTVPHPLLTDRRFALAPLEEIAPFLLHPITGKTIREHLQLCRDEGDVQKKTGWLG
jgi:2-amino-4-hydroxy-6-hydroxymethyldihydropteridine diphosphokinase